MIEEYTYIITITIDLLVLNWLVRAVYEVGFSHHWLSGMPSRPASPWYGWNIKAGYESTLPLRLRYTCTSNIVAELKLLQKALLPYRNDLKKYSRYN